ncbi:hypothetical protein RD792_008900 [Penstemon davidsonii]|uniref:Terpene synthase metal-binding domain-containing protein n=1 Tax=Penstemon davidsonii TaxID=160366 RepID=A0ABR0DAI8_9LAMI|nr:hypothetical protein RD792_008900 [Penstemon davidsonii]
MHALFTSKLNYFPTDECSRLLSSAKLRVQLPEYSTSTSCLNKSRRPLSLYDQVHDRNPKLYSRVAESRALPVLDVSLECGKDDPKDEAFEVKAFEDYIVYINKILSSIGDGRISVSPYDTAFVALIKDLDGNDVPQFPSSLEWIAENQLLDGSWGDEVYFCAFDRLVNTLACVVALKSWNVHGDKSEKGISYIRENVSKLENANAEHMTCGFEVVFPALLQRAQNLGIEGIPYNDPVVREIYAARDQKLKRIPKEMMHKVPTSLLFSLEGLQDLDWEKLLKLQSTDGSFLTSPSSTAFAFMETKDQNCLKFIKNTIEIFNGGGTYNFNLKQISNGLNMPWYSSLPRVEARFYLEHYGGATDVWIGKTLYRMPEISNNAYLELGRLDFNRCQAIHQIEWTYMQEYALYIHTKNNLTKYTVEEFGISREELLIAYFLATASIFEPERSSERIAWAKSQIISKMITSFYNKEITSSEQKVAFLSNFSNSINGVGRTNSYDDGRITILLDALLQFLEGFEGSINGQLKDVVNNIATNSGIKKMEIDEDMQRLVKLVLEESDGINRNTKQTFLQVAKTFYYVAHNDAEKIASHIDKVLFEPVV